MTGRNPSPLDLLLFHRLERDFFARLVGQLGQSPDRTRWVMALWLWFESIGHHDFIRHVAAYPDDTALRFVAEGQACLDRLAGRPSGAGAGTDHGDDLPLTATLVADPMDLRFFDYHRDVAAAGVVHFFDYVASVIFDDAAMESASRDSDHPASIGPAGEGTSIQRGPVSSQQWPSFGLNPMARPWSPATDQSPEGQRSVFITFSRGYPISREEITDFFTSRYGKCVETVMIEKAPAGSPPMYGRVVFTSVSMIAVVLNGQRTAKFMINGKHLWARMYVPRPDLHLV